MADKQRRDALGRWTPGQTGNVAPKWLRSAQRAVQKKIADSGGEAAEVLQGLLQSEDQKVQLAASTYVLNQIVGQPGQSKVISGEIEHRHSLDEQYLQAMRQLAKEGMEAKRKAIIDVSPTLLPETVRASSEADSNGVRDGHDQDASPRPGPDDHKTIP